MSTPAVRLRVSAFLYRTLCCAAPRCLVGWGVVVLEGVCHRLLKGHPLPSLPHLLERCVVENGACLSRRAVPDGEFGETVLDGPPDPCSESSAAPSKIAERSASAREKANVAWASRNCVRLVMSFVCSERSNPHRARTCRPRGRFLRSLYVVVDPLKFDAQSRRAQHKLYKVFTWPSR